MDLNVIYDSSTSAAPSFLKSAVDIVVAQLDALFTNPITVTIDLGWGEENGNGIPSGAVGENQSSGTYLSYAGLTSAMRASATGTDQQTAVANLPAADFTNGGKFYVPLAEQKALGLQSASSGEVDGYVGLNSNDRYTVSTTGQIEAGTYDIVSVLEHEISEVLGRVDYIGQGSATGIYTPEDLFRYAAPGQRSLVAGSGSFSIDGQTLLQSFGNTGDASDWNPSIVGDVFGNVTAGIGSHYSAADFTMMSALGYDVDPGAVSIGSVGPAAAQASAPAPLSVHPAYNADVTSQGGNETFVFPPHTGDVVISNFASSGALHDTLDFGDTGLQSIAAVLRHTQMCPGEAVIHLSKTDTIELMGVTKADLRTHPNLFAFAG